MQGFHVTALPTLSESLPQLTEMPLVLRFPIGFAGIRCPFVFVVVIVSRVHVLPGWNSQTLFSVIDSFVWGICMYRELMDGPGKIF